MKLGIKYCGGCNPRYSRQQEAEKLIRQLSKEQVTVTCDVGQVCDVWVVVHGCMASCGKRDHLKARWEILEACQVKDFVKIKKRLLGLLDKEQKMQRPAWTMDGKRILRTGQRAGMTRTLTKEDVTAFASLTGDFNGIHVDEEAAGRSLYRRPVVHGMLTASLVSAVMGMQLPGEGTIFSGLEVSFSLPVYPGDEIRTEVVFETWEEYPNHYLGHFKGTCRNQADQVVLEAKAAQVLPKRQFVIGS